MHDLVVGIALLPKESQLISLQYHEMLLVALSLGFKVAVSRVFNDVFFRIDILKAAKSIQNDLIGRCLRSHGCRAS